MASPGPGVPEALGSSAAQERELFQELVKKVRIQDRRKIEIWYGLPNPGRLEHWNKWLPGCASIRTRRGRAEVEIFVRMVHTYHPSQNKGPVEAYHEQRVEIGIGPNGAFENGNIGTLTRRVPDNRVVSAVPPRRGKPKPSRKPQTPRVVGLLRKAIEWRRQLDVGDVRNQAEIARRAGISRARVTQVMGLLHLAPEIQEHILAMPKVIHRPAITELVLRSLAQVDDQKQQLVKLQDLYHK
jgi:hypothetical protein